MRGPRTQNAILVGRKYQNGPGQVREVIAITGDMVTFRVVDPGPGGDRKHSLLLMDHHYQNKLSSFRGWATEEVA